MAANLARTLVAGGLALIVFGVPGSAASARRSVSQADTTVYQPGHGVTDPVLIREVKPAYTAGAKKRKVQGRVTLEETVTSKGTVRDVRVTRSLDPELDRQAVKAAKQWRFRPGTKDGKPVNVQVLVELTFKLK